MKIFLTGATGFIGLNLLTKLLKHNFDVMCYVKDPEHQTELESMGCQVVVGNLSERDKMINYLADVDVVIHLVGIGNVAETSDKAYQLYREINLEGTKNIAIAAATKKVKKFIYLSSVAALGSKCEGIMDENSKPAPLVPYERSKWESELVLQDIAGKFRLPIFILRPVWVVGKRSRNEDIIKLAKMIKTRFVPLVNGGRFYTALTSVDSVVEAIFCCINKNIEGYRTYIISDRNSYQQKELIHMITSSLIKYGAVLRRPIIIPIPRFLMLVVGSLCEYLAKILDIPPFLSRKRVYSMSQNRRYSITRAQNELGFSPKDIVSGIEDEIRWLIDKKKI